tara:strand:- start:4 stop:285 length:282 start_codon:yes stop_codon:yes gene_type:complete
MTDKMITRGSVLLKQWINDSEGNSQRALAQDLGVTSAAISNMVTGRNAPSTALAVLIQARTRGAVRVTDWLDPVASARVEQMVRLVGRADGEV